MSDATMIPDGWDTTHFSDEQKEVRLIQAKWKVGSAGYSTPTGSTVRVFENRPNARAIADVYAHDAAALIAAAPTLFDVLVDISTENHDDHCDCDASGGDCWFDPIFDAIAIAEEGR